MTEGGLFKVATALAIAAFIVVVAGATVVSQGVCPTGSLTDDLHVRMSGVSAVFAVVLAAGSWRRSTASDVRMLAMAILLMVIGEGGIGLSRVSSSAGGSTKVLSIVHSSLAQILFAIAATTAVAVSPLADRMQGIRIADSGSPSLRTLAWITPAAVVLQATLGAAFRHGALDVWPHILGSIFVAGLLCFSAMAVYETPNVPDGLRQIAHALLGITITQVLLGLGAYISKLGDTSGSREPWMVALSVSHVALGAMTMGAAFVFGLFADRHTVESPTVATA